MLARRVTILVVINPPVETGSKGTGRGRHVVVTRYYHARQYQTNLPVLHKGGRNEEVVCAILCSACTAVEMRDDLISGEACGRSLAYKRRKCVLLSPL